MAEPYIHKRSISQQRYIATNVPPECWVYDGTTPYGWRASVRATYAAHTIHCSAHFRDRWLPTYGSGMFFNAYRTLEFGREQKTTVVDKLAYLSEGVYYWIGKTLGSACAVTPGRIRWVQFNKSGELTNYNVWYVNFFDEVVTTSGDRSTLISGTDYVGVYQRSAWLSSTIWGVNDGDVFTKVWSRRPSGFDDRPYTGSGQRLTPGISIDGEPAPLEGAHYFNFKDGEYNKYCWLRETGVVLPPYASMASQAYYQAVSSFPAVHSNTIGNILELIDLGRSLVNGGIVRKLTKTKNAKAMKDAWLAYRYSYSTTKSDVAELMAFRDRLNKLPTGDITLRGSVEFSHTTVRCAVVLPYSDIAAGIEDPFSSLGIKVTPQNLWDLVPYSFVVDWFLKVSDWLDYFEKQDFSLRLHPREVWYSIRTAYDDQITYFRWPGGPMLGLPFDMYTQASGKTLCMRIGDVIALS